MDDKIEWMLIEASADGLDLDTNDVAYIINMQGSGEVDFDPAIVDYVLDLDQEWEQRV